MKQEKRKQDERKIGIIILYFITHLWRNNKENYNIRAWNELLSFSFLLCRERRMIDRYMRGAA